MIIKEFELLMEESRNLQKVSVSIGVFNAIIAIVSILISIYLLMQYFKRRDSQQRLEDLINKYFKTLSDTFSSSQIPSTVGK